MAETLMAEDPAAELRREQDRLAKLWQAFKNQEDELERLRRERESAAQTIAQQDKTIIQLRSAMGALKESHVSQEHVEEVERRNKVLLHEVESLHRDLRAAQNQLESVRDLREAGITKESHEALQGELRKEQERLAKLFKVYEEQEAEAKALHARLAKWEEWFARMEPAIVALPRFFADAPRA